MNVFYKFATYNRIICILHSTYELLAQAKKYIIVRLHFGTCTILSHPNTFVGDIYTIYEFLRCLCKRRMRSERQGEAKKNIKKLTEKKNEMSLQQTGMMKRRKRRSVKTKKENVKPLNLLK